MSFDTRYFAGVRAAVSRLGGLFNAHLHLDRSDTIRYTATSEKGGVLSAAGQLSLASKHGLIPGIHAGPAYDPENLSERANFFLDRMVEAGTSRADTLVDVTNDRVGLTALEVFLEIRKRRAGGLSFGLGAYSPLGFTDAEPERWQMLERGAARADFIGSLPERDDQHVYPSHIGFSEHCRRMLLLGRRLGKALHIHVDQRNDPSETGTETVIQAIAEVGQPASASGEPMVWLIHVISPSTYEEDRFARLLADLVRLDIGIICCPSAAISMRQLRPLRTPTFNSIARVLDMLAAGLHVRIGSDNICDVSSPAGTPDLMAEVFVLTNATRFYDTDIVAKVAAGVRLSASDRARIEEHLQDDRREIDRVVLQRTH